MFQWFQSSKKVKYERFKCLTGLEKLAKVEISEKSFDFCVKNKKNIKKISSKIDRFVNSVKNLFQNFPNNSLFNSISLPRKPLTHDLSL